MRKQEFLARLRLLRFGCRYYVAGLDQYLLPEMPQRRNGDVCVLGIGR